LRRCARSMAMHGSTHIVRPTICRTFSSWPNDKGTVAVTEIDGKLYFGVNSGAPGYTTADQKEADTWRRVLADKYPNELSTKNIGSVPNDSFYHAESTVLLRAARENNGTLEGRIIVVHADREVCATSCLRSVAKAWR